MDNQEMRQQQIKLQVNSLKRVLKICGYSHEVLTNLDNWELEDLAQQYVGQLHLALKREQAKVKRLKGEIDMLRQTSIFDFLKIHHEEIKAQQTPSDLGDNG
jgi:hypothetical protein